MLFSKRASNFNNTNNNNRIYKMDHVNTFMYDNIFRYFSVSFSQMSYSRVYFLKKLFYLPFLLNNQGVAFYIVIYFICIQTSVDILSVLGIFFLLVLHMVCIITSASVCLSFVKSQRGDSGIHLNKNERESIAFIITCELLVQFH